MPERLHATYVPAHGAFALWGAETDIAGRRVVCRLALPQGERVEPADVEACLVGPDELPGATASARAWREAVRLVEKGADDDAFAELAQRMPPAAHAILNAEETAISSAAALLDRYRRAAAARAKLGAINADLRPYQVDGVAWLHSVPGGGVLADEMGLGKTLQAICLLATRDGPHLVVCPTSLVGNWRREIGRFAPDTPVLTHHGPRRDLPRPVPPRTVVLTSYSVLRSDSGLADVDWDVVVLDEAQQVKNPDAQASKAAARLSAQRRVAMTGTPVENRLDELWAIMSLTNPGLLGTRARFRQRFGAPVEQRRSATAAARLNALITPHVLRRTKSEVATDLPPKVYSTVACTLTAEQAQLYRDAVERAFTDGLGAGIERRGRVLALLTALKQICNHPAQYRPDELPLTGRSGKFDRATEMLTEIVEDDDRALVFTQYRTMGELLSRHLAHQLGGPVPFLHGGLTAAQRDELVRAFQHDDDAPPVLLLSLRAAGFGLNLTRAGHVMHYDRWWNPAVEEQATDRAHRIGQTRPLTVHTLVTGGTIEDHIARLHENKRALAEAVSGAETAFADLTDEQLHDVLDLDPGALS
ncbi:DEAD/DEAH box helicase [Allokutzneria albata]|uniref:Helicase conserved C-terminal domain-containing protein n=1 Tax=Allokutzneria albata TaxID=211114 RepID=A0A1G9T897_ALLAB|nr:DEAD/DEAH box helicase [Allokutzneria albata]SDM43943.1 Helicase conserved C-terminal domain-containing protein [Allokutzneria albata]